MHEYIMQKTLNEVMSTYNLIEDIDNYENFGDV